MRRRCSVAGVAIAAALLLAASCTQSTSSPPTTGPGSTARPKPTAGPVTLVGEAEGVTVANPDRCEFFDPVNCLLPFPSNHFTKPDPTTETKMRVDLAASSMPANTAGTPIDPTEWNRNDGFSPSAPIVLHVAGVDLERTGAAPVTDIGRSLDAAAPIVLLDADTGERVPTWSELDAQVHLDEAKAGPDRRALLIHPARNLLDGHRYVVALRNLRNAEGAPIPPPPVFAAYRDRLRTDDAAVEARRGAMEDVFAQLEATGIARNDLYLAWDYTVASTRNLTGRVLHMRDETFAPWGTDGAPTFTVDKVTTDGLPDGVLRMIDGTIDVPNYLTDGGAPGGQLANGSAPDGLPTREGTYQANFVCVVPTTAQQTPAMSIVYGHGLLGSAEEGRSVGLALAARENIATCATDWIGLSRRDVAAIAGMLADLSRFRQMPDRLQQAMLDFLVLGRAMKSPKGFGTDAAFQGTGGASLLGPDLAYLGSSQGGIKGGSTSAIAQDWSRVFLGVPGESYALLLNRSVDFDEYAVVLRDNYPDALEQQLVFGMLQMLWDRGETSGYVQHLTDRAYDRTPKHQVLMTVAFGDHQVATITADNIARTLKLPIYRPTLPDDTQPMLDVDTPQPRFFFNVSPIRKFPLDGSALYYWYDGTLPPPLGNITPTMSSAYQQQCAGTKADTQVQCQDPHGVPRRMPQVIAQKKAFFKPEGVITNVCRDEPCLGKPRSEFDY